MMIKNLYTKIRFCWGDFAPDARSPEGILKSPMGEGIWGKNHETKSEFYTYFF